MLRKSLLIPGAWFLDNVFALLNTTSEVSALVIKIRQTSLQLILLKLGNSHPNNLDG